MGSGGLRAFGEGESGGKCGCAGGASREMDKWKRNELSAPLSSSCAGP